MKGLIIMTELKRNLNTEEQELIQTPIGRWGEAGRNRYVPIHSKILPLIIKRYEKSNTMLFEDINSSNGIEMTYDKYRERFMNIMDYLGLKHKPHETRHTFITKGGHFTATASIVL